GEDGFVETIVFTQTVELGLRQRHAITGAHGRATGNTHLLGFHNCTLQRPTGYQSGDNKHNDGYTNQGGRNQQQSSQKVITHWAVLFFKYSEVRNVVNFS